MQAVDAIGAFPPIMESHVEMDGAWALYEAWVKILTGEADVALAYGFGKSSAGDLRRVLTLQLDPYLLAPLWPDSVSIAALQARLGIEAGLWSEKAMAEVAARSRAAALANPQAQLPASSPCEDLLAEPYVADPLRAHDCAPVGDGAAVVILAAGDRARELCARPAWITGFDHRIDSASLGARDLTTAPSATAAGRAAGGRRRRRRRRAARAVHPPGAPAAAGARPGRRRPVNPSGGALCGNPMFAAGLARIGLAARRDHGRPCRPRRGPRHQGPALQQNLVCMLEARWPKQQAAVLGVGQTRHRAARPMCPSPACARGGGPGARRRRARPGRHRRGGDRQGARTSSRA